MPTGGASRMKRNARIAASKSSAFWCSKLSTGPPLESARIARGCFPSTPTPLNTLRMQTGLRMQSERSSSWTRRWYGSRLRCRRTYRDCRGGFDPRGKWTNPLEGLKSWRKRVGVVLFGVLKRRKLLVLLGARTAKNVTQAGVGHSTGHF